MISESVSQRQYRQQKVSLVPSMLKDYILECEICFQEFDSDSHCPMIICSNFHTLCSSCVESNLFKKQYDSKKNPTGRYCCSKCSQLINKGNIRPHRILTEISKYMESIKRKDEELKKELYNHIGSMGMGLVSMRDDFDSIEKNNFALEKENEGLRLQNAELREKFRKIEETKGSFEELSKAFEQLESLRQEMQIQQVSLNSVREEVNKNMDLLKSFKLQNAISENEVKRLEQTKNSLLKQQQKINRNIRYLNEERNSLAKEVEGEKKQLSKIVAQNELQRQRLKKAAAHMTEYWQNILSSKDAQLPALIQAETEGKSKQSKKPLAKKGNILVQGKEGDCISKQQDQLIKHEKKNEKVKAKFESIFNTRDKSSKMFEIDSNIVRVLNPNLTSYASISLNVNFLPVQSQHYLKLKILRLDNDCGIIGLTTEKGRSKRRIYESDMFVGIESNRHLWKNGEFQKCVIGFSKGDVFEIRVNNSTGKIHFIRNGGSFSTTIPEKMRNSTLIPVIQLMEVDDAIEVLATSE